MDYTLMPSSLEHRALIKTAITLWNDDDIRAFIGSKFDSIILSFDRWRVVENKVVEKVPELPLPESLKKKLLDFIYPIGYEILKWIRYYKKLFLLERIAVKFVMEILRNLCWTQLGTIDKKKTAEVLIRDENLDITEKYTIACNYCLKNDILALWNKLPIIWGASCYGLYTNNQLVNFWTCNITEKLHRMKYIAGELKWDECSPYQYAFEYAAARGKIVATEYLFQFLTSEERKESLVRSAKDCCHSYRTSEAGYYADVLFFLFSQMNEDQQLEVLRGYSREVLECFLDWPFQGAFMEMAKLVWPFLSEYSFLGLLTHIIDKIKLGFKDYKILFREFWQQSPITHKTFVIDNCVPTLLELFKIKDEESVKLILNELSTPDRKKFIFSFQGKKICEILTYTNTVDLLEFFVQEYISSKDEMIKFEAFIKRQGLMETPAKNCLWSKLFITLFKNMEKKGEL